MDKRSPMELSSDDEELEKLKKKLEEYRKEGELLMKKKNELLFDKVNRFRQNHKYVYAIKKGKPNPRIAVFDSYEKAKSNIPKWDPRAYTFYIEKCRSKDISEQELIDINK